MKYLHTSLVVLAAASAFAFAGCTCEADHHDHHAMAHHAGMWAGINEAVAVISPTKGNTCSGVIHFTKTPDGIHITGEVSGLEPGSEHAFHIHEFGDQSSADGMSSGGHFNPEGHPHGGPHDAMHHAGDFGNITADAGGVARIDLLVSDISIVELRNPIIGRGVVIHAKADDLKTQPTGNAGGRIGVGVIGIARVVATTQPAATPAK